MKEVRKEERTKGIREGKKDGGEKKIRVEGRKEKRTKERTKN